MKFNKYNNYKCIIFLCNCCFKLNLCASKREMKQRNFNFNLNKMERAQNGLVEDVMICNYKGCTQEKV